MEGAPLTASGGTMCTTSQRLLSRVGRRRWLDGAAAYCSLLWLSFNPCVSVADADCRCKGVLSARTVREETRRIKGDAGGNGRQRIELGSVTAPRRGADRLARAVWALFPCGAISDRVVVDGDRKRIIIIET